MRASAGPRGCPGVPGRHGAGRRRVPFTPVYQRLREDLAWETYVLDGGHNLMRDAPQDLLKILLARETARPTPPAHTMDGLVEVLRESAVPQVTLPSGRLCRSACGASRLASRV